MRKVKGIEMKFFFDKLFLSNKGGKMTKLFIFKKIHGIGFGYFRLSLTQNQVIYAFQDILK